MSAGATVTLKPCPFCGGEAHPPKPMGGHPSAIRLVQCSRSEYCGSVVGGTDAEAITAWNTRATAAEFAAREAALVEAATALASDVQELIDCRGDCGEWGSECPLQDAHKPDSTIDRLQRLLDVLAARAHTTSEGEG